MQGLLKEGEKLVRDTKKSPVLDVALIGAAQKVEHYEIAAYGTARAMAEMLGQADAAELLQETLDEEMATDERLSEIAEAVMTGDEIEEEAEEEPEEEEITSE